MNTLEKYLANESLNLKDPSIQRDLYQNIADGLEKTGPASSLACTGLEKHLRQEGKEPEYPELAEGAPSKNLAAEIRKQNILPSMESHNTYRNLYKNELPGLTEKTDSEIASFEKNLAYEASGFQRGLPETSQEKLGLEVMEKSQKGGKFLDNLSNDIDKRVLEGMEEAMKQVHGASKALTGLLKGDKDLYAIGMEECKSIGMLNRAYQFQVENFKSAGEVLLGKKEFEILGEKIAPLAPVEKAIETLSKAINDPGGFIKSLKNDTLDKARQGDLGPLGMLATDPKNLTIKNGVESFGKQFIEGQTKALEALKAPGPAMVAVETVSKLLGGPNIQENLTKQYQNLETHLKSLLVPDKGSGSPAGAEENTPLAPKKGAGSQEGKETENDPASPAKKAEDPPFFEKFAGLLSSRVAFDKAMKKGASPKQAGDLSQLALDDTKENTKGLDNSLEKNSNAVMQGAKTFATHALSKAALAAPPPLGIALSLSIQIASSLADSLGDKSKENEQNKQSPSSSPLQGLAEAIPGNLDASGAGGLASKTLKLGKSALSKAFPKGLAGAGDIAGDAAAKKLSQKPEDIPDHFKAVDRPI